MLMKVQCPMAKIPIEGLDEEHRLGIFVDTSSTTPESSQLQSDRVELRYIGSLRSN